jgi:hypothetical protein
MDNTPITDTNSSTQSTNPSSQPRPVMSQPSQDKPATPFIILSVILTLFLFVSSTLAFFFYLQNQNLRSQTTSFDTTDETDISDETSISEDESSDSTAPTTSYSHPRFYYTFSHPSSWTIITGDPDADNSQTFSGDGQSLVARLIPGKIPTEQVSEIKAMFQGQVKSEDVTPDGMITIKGMKYDNLATPPYDAIVTLYSLSGDTLEITFHRSDKTELTASDQAVFTQLISTLTYQTQGIDAGLAQ